MPSIRLGDIVVFRTAGCRRAAEVIARASCSVCGRRVLLTSPTHTLEDDASELHAHQAAPLQLLPR